MDRRYRIPLLILILGFPFAYMLGGNIRSFVLSQRWTDSVGAVNASVQHKPEVVFVDAQGSLKSSFIAACAVESAARIYRNQTIRVYIKSFKGGDSGDHKSEFLALNLLSELENIIISPLDPASILQNTPLVSWYTKVTYKNKYWKKFTSLAFQLALAWNYGGVFLGTDYISTKAILEENFVLRQNSKYINDGVFGFTDHSQFVWDCIEDFVHQYNRAVWGQHPPAVMTRVVNALCNHSAPYVNQQDSLCGTNNVKLLHHLRFYPVSCTKSGQQNPGLNDSYGFQIKNYPKTEKVPSAPVGNNWVDGLFKKYCPSSYAIFIKHENGNHTV